MKAVQKISYLLIVFIICIFTGCDQEGNEKNGSDIRIVKELRKMYFSPVDTEMAAIINSMAEFDKLIQDKENLQNYPELESIDWSNQTLLLGHCSYKNQANIIHHFYQVDNLEYLYHVSISGYTSGTDNFLFGVIIDKLPENSTVTFEIEKEEGVEINSPFIMMELPKMYIEGLADGETKIINDSLNFSRCFTNEDLERYPDLKDINWNNHTLLVGHYFYPYLVNIRHEFNKINDLDYIYNLVVKATAATAIDNFTYGIIVSKLPQEANVIFNIDLEDPFMDTVELPKMDIKSLEVGASKIINNKEEFNAVFSSDDIKRYPVLNNINWDLYTLLVNRYVNPTLIVSYNHSFKKKASLNYLYLLEITSGDATAIDDFAYGLLVPKLPGNAIVEFVVKEIS